MSETFIQWRRRMQDAYPGCRIDSMNQNGTTTGAKAMLDIVAVGEWPDPLPSPPSTIDKET